ncbi:MAG: long-chain fatty acid--CoA ligase [Actinomycetota bacterium]|nr:long-chain fatty acid--CoA ligase [Actinomycetota bacterium]
MSARPAIERELLAWMGEPDRAEWRADDPRFERLALELFAFQFEANPAYGRFCAARDRTPADVRSWRDIPAVPAGAFKELELRCFPAEATQRVFRTSGTSGAGGQRGALHLDTLALYEASLRPTLRRLLFPDVAAAGEGGAATTIRVLAPSPGELPDSSLSHMFGCLLDDLGDEHSGYDVVGGELRSDALARELDDACNEGRPVALCGTAFAFVHLLDDFADQGRRFACAPGSRIMETGGFKGRSRELSRDTLHAALHETLGIPPGHIVNQYGMTELGSQFYDSVFVDPAGPRRKLGPPWARVRLVDPETGGDAEGDAPGLVVIHDLANTGSVAAIQTADLGRWIDGGATDGSRGFEVLGREPGAEARGCSIAADLMLGGDAPADERAPRLG